jgi:NAD(P)-dependent dehydrogenase (short-subunit alcohol dehydrogenase family)
MTDYFDMTGKVVLITGGTRGLGLAMAKGFAEQGADLIITSRHLDQCQEAATEVTKLGRRALPYACHVGRWSELDGLVETAYAEFGKVDVLINNAGMSPVVGASVNVTEELFDKIVGVNFKGPFRLSTLIGERMVKVGKGSIINVTSAGAVRPHPLFTAYAGAKGALNIATKALALEYGPAVRVNAIMPGPFWTEISKSWREEADKASTSAMRRIGRPEEIITTALYLASDKSSFTTGTVIEVSGGER